MLALGADTKNLTRVEGMYLVNLTTGEVWVEKSSKRGNTYLSTITSARKIRRLTKLAKALVDPTGTKTLSARLAKAIEPEKT